ncbi:hypothetical protein O3M35_012228 [Rhynocoris fuscipes]|uniref:Uncharacterized protein n=1 Tax=Rhynocoris fuscipes TaxID=488301 RepID=A0AAW1CZ18_9HEMI
MNKFELNPNYNEIFADVLKQQEENRKEVEEEHNDDVQLKEGLWKSCNEEIYVDLATNNLTEFQWEKYKDFKNLVYIYLNENQLTEINGEIFTEFPNLFWLDLRENKLTSFPKEVKNHPKLNTILLDHNQISVLPIELGSLPELIGLSIFGNPIQFPSKEILKLRQSQLLEYLKRSWESKSHDLSFLEPKSQERKYPKKNSKIKPKKIEEVGAFVSRNWKSKDAVDQVLADTLVKNIEEQNEIIQKRKDAECLRQWRDKYSSYKNLPVFKMIDAPPFGIYDEFSKMPNRSDIKTTLNIKSKPSKVLKPKRKRHQYLTAELKKIQETMDRISSAPMPPEIDKKSLNEAMASRIEDIKALREIQRRVNELRLKM